MLIAETDTNNLYVKQRRLVGTYIV